MLADYILAFRALLDAYDLQYGMFGHVDAGVLHVRPLLNLQVQEDAALIRRLSDQVAALVKRFGGVLWGEHGKGMRGEYLQQFIGAPLQAAMQQIKACFDPHYRLNPGKLVAPKTQPQALYAVDQAWRAHTDQLIPVQTQTAFAPIMRCNGNGLCFDDDATQLMCPSYKATRDRVHSPKGRATLMRAWLQSQGHTSLAQLRTSPKLYFMVALMVACIADRRHPRYGFESIRMDGRL